MDEDGNFAFKKPEPVEAPPQEGSSDNKVELDPYAGTNIDASQLGQMQEEALQGSKKQEESSNHKK